MRFPIYKNGNIRLPVTVCLFFQYIDTITCNSKNSLKLFLSSILTMYTIHTLQKMSQKLWLKWIANWTNQASSYFTWRPTWIPAVSGTYHTANYFISQQKYCTFASTEQMQLTNLQLYFWVNDMKCFQDNYYQIQTLGTHIRFPSNGLATSDL